MPALEGGPGSMDALKGPCIAIRPAQLTAEHGQGRRIGACTSEEILQPGNPEFASRLDSLQQPSKLWQCRMTCVMIGTHKHSDVAGRCPGDQGRSNSLPDRRQPFGIRRKRCADLIPIRRQVIKEDIAAVGPAPAVEIAILPLFASNTPPDHTVSDAELGSHRWPDCRMPEGIG